MSMYTAASGAEVNKMMIEVIAANISAAGVKGKQAKTLSVQEIFSRTIREAGVQNDEESARTPQPLQIGNGVIAKGTTRNLTQGQIVVTNDNLSFAILGSGYYFPILSTGGRVGFTRNGAFKRDAETGQLVTEDGKFVDSDIVIPENVDTTTILVAKDGTMTATDPDNPGGEKLELGQLALFRFTNHQGLKEEDNLFFATIASGEEIEVEDLYGKIQQGAHEASNVSTVTELVKLLEAERMYSQNLRIINIISDMEKKAAEAA